MRESTKATRATILQSAKEIFLECGYQEASMRKIAARAGITPGAIYKHFSGKEEMFGEIFAESGNKLMALSESMLDIAYELKKRKAGRIFAYATYPIFTNGLEAFDKAYEEGVIAGVLGTNLTYRTPALRQREWFCEVDVSKYIAYFIAALNHDVSVSLIIDPHEKIKNLLAEHRACQGR